MYGARRALIASQETNKYRVFVGELHAPDPGLSQLHWLESSPLDRETYLYESDADACLATKKDGAYLTIAVDRDGMRMRNGEQQPLASLAKLYPFKTVATVSFLFAQEWWGRIFCSIRSWAGIEKMTCVLAGIGPSSGTCGV